MLRVIIKRQNRFGRGTGRLQITEEHHGTDIQLDAIGGKALGTSKGALS